jgi:hypothetical protein
MIFVTGDLGPLAGWPPYNGAPYKAMPTAIVRIVTPEGIVVAADGLQSSSFFLRKSEHLQKIYPLQGLPLAYAIYGATGAWNYENKEQNVVIDLVREAKQSAELLGNLTFSDLSLYASQFARPIVEALKAKIGDDSLIRYPSVPYDPVEPGQTIMHVFFFGYYNGSASTVDLRIFHRNEILAEPSITPIQVDMGPPPWIRGSKIIAKLLFESDDKRFTPYRMPFPSDPEKLTVERAAEIASGYIQACCSEAGREADPDVAISIGGHIHIARITPHRFKWLIPPTA